MEFSSMFRNNVLRLINDRVSQGTQKKLRDENDQDFVAEIIQQAQFCLKYGSLLVGRDNEIQEVRC